MRAETLSSDRTGRLIRLVEIWSAIPLTADRARTIDNISAIPRLTALRCRRGQSYRAPERHKPLCPLQLGYAQRFTALPRAHDGL